MERPEENVHLAAHLKAVGLKQRELARLLNDQIAAVTGTPGTVHVRHVRRWLRGQTRWPHALHRTALEAVFECSIDELGFAPTRRKQPAQPPTGASPGSAQQSEDHVERRRFFTAASGTAIAGAPAIVIARNRVGTADVNAIQGRLAELAAADDRQGGSTDMEKATLAQAKRALILINKGSASQRIRQHLYAAAADATAAAAWAAIDSDQLERAQSHLDRALSLSGMSQDPVSELRSWNNIAMLASQRRRYADSAAAAQRARRTAIARNDPLFASFCHARAALAYAGMQDAPTALRSLRHAENSFERATPQARPGWMRFYDEAELHGLTAIVYQRLGQHDKAEYRTHQALARLKPGFERNRAYYTARLALAQLHQGDLETAFVTVGDVLTPTPALPVTGRVNDLLSTFRAGVSRTDSRIARSWLDQHTTPEKGRQWLT